jgi:hypothetical protein
MKIFDKLFVLHFYYAATRGKGHTALMKEGTKHYQGNKFVLVEKMHEHKNTETRLCETISLDSLDKLRGSDRPLAIDNHALITIFDDSMTEILNLESEVDRLTKNSIHYLLTIEELKNEINTMKKKPFTTFFKSILKK